MKSLVHNFNILIVAIIGFIGGLFWGVQSNWEYEPMILLLVSISEIFFYFILPKDEARDNTQAVNIANSISNTNGQNNVITNNGSNNQNNQIDIQILGLGNPTNGQNVGQQNSINDKNLEIDSKKTKISILFIDDDKNFNIVKILKDSGWKNTKTIIDVKSLDDQNIKNSEIIFVDINGVGKLLNLPHEGLDLALMIKQKYPNKKVVIYSANNYSNSFHEAWSVADSRLEKNALPYQFQSLVENYSSEYYNN